MKTLSIDQQNFWKQNPDLKDRIEKAVIAAVLKYKLTREVGVKIHKDLMTDLILPSLLLRSNVAVKFLIEDIEDGETTLTCIIDRRDWQWDAKTGELVGCGTFLG